MEHRLTFSNNLLVVLAASKNRNANRQVQPKVDEFKVRKANEINTEVYRLGNSKQEKNDLLFARA